MKKVITTMSFLFMFLLTMPAGVHAQEVYVNSVDRALDTEYLNTEEDLMYYNSAEYGMYEAAMDALTDSGINPNKLLSSSTLSIDGVATGFDSTVIGTDDNVIGTDNDVIGTDSNIVGTESNVVGTEDAVITGENQTMTFDNNTYSTDGIITYFEGFADEASASGYQIAVPQVDFNNDGSTKSNVAENTTNKIIRGGLILLYLLAVGFILVEIVAGKRTVWSVIMGIAAILFISALFFFPDVMLSGLLDFMTT